MTDILARKKAAESFLAGLDTVWHANRLSFAPYTDDAKLSNNQIANCEHVKEIFKDTRVFQKEADFHLHVCKRALDAVSNHPVLFAGKWRQGKSALVSSLLYEAKKEQGVHSVDDVEENRPSSKAKAQTESTNQKQPQSGRYARTTNKVDLFEVKFDDVGTIWLADTPGLEPDEKHDIMQGLREELKKRQRSEHVFTDVIVLVIAGHSEGLSGLSSTEFMDWLQDTYSKARESASMRCVILPVVTHGDTMDMDEIASDLSQVKSRLSEVAAKHKGSKAVSCGDAQAEILDPLIVTNYAWYSSGKVKREGRNVDSILREIHDQVLHQSSTRGFFLQWSQFLTEDLQRMVVQFQAKHEDEETERRLFHRTLAAILATYNQQAFNMESAFPKPAWNLLPTLERQLRGEESQQERWQRYVVARMPTTPSALLPLSALVVCGPAAWRYGPRVMSRIQKLCKGVFYGSP
ncbi:unnamed protein product [Symbiodinium sp. CCMP2592]|nr:unnamed protein product [Symbiodinium sp. CCMP2592]